MKSRRAISILELLMIMSASTALLTLTGVLLQRAMLIQIRSRAYDNAERASLRLSEQLRSDIHQARRVSTDSDNADKDTFLRLEIDGGRTVEYKREHGVVRRLETVGNQPQRREEYELPAKSELTAVQTSVPKRVALTIMLQPAEQVPIDRKTIADANIVPFSLSVEAVVGRYLRLTRAPNGAEDHK
jgi:hypothetical protein